MTVIAWDGHQLAADKLACYGDHTFTVTKIARVGDVLVGVSGRGDRITAFQEWVRAGRDVHNYPANAGGADFWLALVIDRAGVVQRYEETPWPLIVEDPTAAIGVGADFARAAMHLGRTAREAVEVACLFSANCGNGVDVLTLEE